MLILLDRDGVINEDRADFVKSPAELKIIPGALEAIRRLNDAGHPVVITTNQSCIGRGIISLEMLGNIHQTLLGKLAAVGGHIDEIFIAPDAPWAATENRKPGPGMLLQAMEKFRSSAQQTVMIGDSLRDLQAAQAVGCARILVQTGKGKATQKKGIPPEILPLKVVSDLGAAVDHLLGAHQ